MPPSIQIRPEIWLDPRRALWLAKLRLLVLADLHWGYAVSQRARGHLLPLWGDEQIALRLMELIAEYRPREMLWLGDSLHALPGQKAAEEFLARDGLPTVTILAGNHDRRWARAEVAFLEREGYFFHHGDQERVIPEGALEIVGHHHPAVSWYDGAGGHLKIPALVEGAHRLILPAFSPWAAGTPWNGALREDESLWAVSPKRVFRFKTNVARGQGT